jgi:hypothetical protein
MLLGRHSIGYELDKLLKPLIMVNLESAPTFNHIAHGRLLRHLDFIKNRECKYYNSNLNCNVVSNYETDIRLDVINSINRIEGENLEYQVEYEPLITNINNRDNEQSENKETNDE